MTTVDLGFGFDDAIFSDKILRFAILPDDGDHHTSTSDCKRKRNEHDECREPICDDKLKNFEGEASQQKEPSCDERQHSAFQEKSINVNSLILAGHSPFFLKLFSNGMKESGERQAIIHIQASEEAAFMDMLKFMYSGKLSRNTPEELVQILRIADKFSAASCVEHCSQLLNTIPMTVELALLYLDLDSAGLMVDSVKECSDKAKKFLPEYFKDMSGANFKEELLALPLAGVKAVLSSDCLQIKSEDKIYDFIVKWVQIHYPDQVEEKRKMLSMLIRRYLRFPFVSSSKLEEIMSSGDIDHSVASEIALRSLSYHQAQFPEKGSRKLNKRAYKRPPLKVVTFDELTTRPQFIVYLHLNREECEKLSVGGFISSEGIVLRNHKMKLIASRSGSEQSSDFMLSFRARAFHVSDTAGLNFCWEIASVKKPSKEFVVIRKQHVNGERFALLFRGPWETFVSKDSPYIINGILRLRFHLMIMSPLFD